MKFVPVVRDIEMSVFCAASAPVVPVGAVQEGRKNSMGPMRVYCEIRRSAGRDVGQNRTDAYLSRLSGKKPLDMWGGRSMQLAISV
ncbi:hypothetical protein [Pandoraea bronchicola]|uniref:hypothetical protein n=1 Tax=Pandoraea bronchicola TaxID=2508287 RepID=UPI0012404131|nr:hypothetical protein [Pandoraea bronchicola]